MTGNSPDTRSSVNSIINYDFAGRRGSIGEVDTLAIGNTTTQTLLKYFYNDDLNNQIIGRGIAYDSARSTSGYSYNYNADGALTSTTGWGVFQGMNTSYNYDFNGNRTSDTNHSSITVTPNNRISTDGTLNYFYDANGNLTKKIQISTSQETDYTWDYRNRLVEVQQKTASGTLTLDEVFTYDPLDRRIGASVTTWDANGNASTSATYTAYDGTSTHPYADFIGTSTTPSTRYLWADAGAVDLLLARLDGASGVAWYLTDEEGSVQEIVDPNGNVLDRMNYGPFGELLAESNPSAGDRFKYASGAYDPNTGLIQFGLRYYDPSSGRWISQDPGGYAMGDSNLYRYVGNSPTSAVDPSGLRAVTADGSLQGYGGSSGWNVPQSAPSNQPWLEQWGYGDNSVVAGLAGILQGGANTINGIQDAAVDVANTASWAYNRTIGSVTSTSVDPLEKSDWSRDYWVYEDDQTHDLSKKLGGQGTLTLATGGITPVIAASRAGCALGALGNTLSNMRGVGAALGFAGNALKVAGVAGGLLSVDNGLRNTGTCIANGDPLGALGNATLTAMDAISVVASILSACFAAGTPLRTPDGHKRIEDFQVGDLILSRRDDDPFAPVSVQRVEEVFQTDAFLRVVRVAGQEISTTPEHPFWVKDKGWTAANLLQAGDLVAGNTNEWLTVDRVDATEEFVPVFNLRIAEDHTYFVGELAWGFAIWAHNSNGCVHRVGGGDASNLAIKPNEVGLNPPGISVLIGGTPADTTAAFRRVFGPKSTLGKSARTVGTAEIENIRAAGFDVVPVETNNFPNHGRIIHPTEGAAGFTPENLQRLAHIFINTTGL